MIGRSTAKRSNQKVLCLLRAKPTRIGDGQNSTFSRRIVYPSKQWRRGFLGAFLRLMAETCHGGRQDLAIQKGSADGWAGTDPGASI